MQCISHISCGIDGIHQSQPQQQGQQNVLSLFGASCGDQPLMTADKGLTLSLLPDDEHNEQKVLCMLT